MSGLTSMTDDYDDPQYKVCIRCHGVGTVRENDQIIECPDCESEGLVDGLGYPPSYSAPDRRAQENDDA